MVETVIQQQQAGNGTNGNVTALAVLQFVFGGVIILAGLLTAILGATASAFIGEAFAEWGGESWGALGAVMFIVVGLIMLLFGIPSIFAGVGLIKYQNWGRILTLIMATLAGISAIMSLIDLDLTGVILPGGFAAYAWIILTRPHIVALFGRGGSQQQAVVVETT